MIKLAIFIALLGLPIHDVPVQHNASVSLAWNGSSGAAYYTLYWGKNSGHYGNSVEATQTTATVGVPHQKKVYFAVTATNFLEEESGYSNEVSEFVQ